LRGLVDFGETILAAATIHWNHVVKLVIGGEQIAAAATVV